MVTERPKRLVAALVAFVLILAAVSVLLHSYTAFVNPLNYQILNSAAIAVSAEAPLKAKPELIEFSLTDYFYKEAQRLHLNAAAGIEKIYYTLDSTPPQTSETAERYIGTIQLMIDDRAENVCSYTVKACGVYSDGSFTETYTHSYFISPTVFERFDVPVFMLSTDPDNLYNYDDGIFVTGKRRDEFLETMGSGYRPTPLDPANYNVRGIESERPVYVEAIDENGRQLLAQNAGMRTYGAYSRDMLQKSIKLYARSEYDEKNTFSYPFFGDDESYNGTNIRSYKRLVLRNNANDNMFSFMRDEVISKCAELTDLVDTQNSRACAVFLNGEYYGFAWLKEVYDSNYFDDKNGTNNGTWVRIEGGERLKTDDRSDITVTRAIAEYERIYDMYSNADLRSDETFSWLCKDFDIDNLLTYYAVQIYVNNGDWPGGNVEIYKFRDTPIEYFNDNNGTIGTGTGTADGRWRFLLFDTDFGLGLYDSSPATDTLATLLGKERVPNEQRISPLLISILRREDMRNKFAAIMCDLQNHAYSPKNVYNTINAKVDERMNELVYNFSYGIQLKDNWSNLGYVENDVAKAIRFSEERPAYVSAQVSEHLGFGDEKYTINIAQTDNAKIRISTVDIDDFDEDFSGEYYNELSLPLSVKVREGFEFEYYLINGKKYFEPEMLVDYDMATGNAVDISVSIAKKTENLYPQFYVLDYENAEDSITLFNPYDTPISLKGLYISDQPSIPYRQALPDVIIPARSRLFIYCKNNSVIESLGEYCVDFNLTGGETLTITDSEGVTIESLYLPELDSEYILHRNIDGYGGFHVESR
jgi:hypothetical protein